MPYDLLIRNATVIDGTRAPRFQADIGVRDGKIEQLGGLARETGRVEIDAAGLVAAPGFIDAHTHDDADLATKIAMPMLVLWGEKSHVNRSYKPMEAWRERAADVSGKMLPCGHYPAEQAPEETLAELLAFFR